MDCNIDTDIKYTWYRITILENMIYYKCLAALCYNKTMDSYDIVTGIVIFYIISVMYSLTYTMCYKSTISKQI